jgi:hypothetical protein
MNDLEKPGKYDYILIVYIKRRDEGDLLSLIDVGSLFHNLTVEGRK